MKKMKGRTAAAAAAKTKGRPRRRWTARERQAAILSYMTDLDVMGNLAAAARKHGVPESTLRSWLVAEISDGDSELMRTAKAARTETICRACDAALEALTEIQRRIRAGEYGAPDLTDVTRMLWRVVSELPDAPARADAAAGGVVFLAEVMPEPDCVE
jgi:transposase-like protein